MHLTVAICTHNRSAQLARTLESFERLRTPDGATWEVLVVQNRCTDATAGVVDRFRERLPLRTTLEPELGLCYARNAAVEGARGDYIVWTDDDVAPRPDWLAVYADAFRRWPDASFFGGPVVLRFLGDETPGWLETVRREFPSVYAGRDLGDRAFRIDERAKLPYGANYALQLPVQEEFRYDPELGRRGSDLLSGEETDLMGRVLEEGAHGRWVPGAGVRHMIPEERQTTGYFRRFFRSHGRVSAAREGQEERLPTLLGRPRWAWRAAVEMEVRHWTARVLGSPDDWVPLLRDAAYAQGFLLGPPRRGRAADDERAPEREREAA